MTALRNVLAVWSRDELGIELSPGVDEVSLALVADAWSRTYRSRALTLAAASSVTSRNGTRIIPDRTSPASTVSGRLSLPDGRTPVESLDETLAEIGERYGERTADIVAMQLEYPFTAPRGDDPRRVAPSELRGTSAPLGN